MFAKKTKLFRIAVRIARMGIFMRAIRALRGLDFISAICYGPEQEKGKKEKVKAERRPIAFVLVVALVLVLEK
jgi:hypothetical protein